MVQRSVQEDQLKTKDSVTIMCIREECTMKVEMQTGQTEQNVTEYKLKSFVTGPCVGLVKPGGEQQELQLGDGQQVGAADQEGGEHCVRAGGGPEHDTGSREG